MAQNTPNYGLQKPLKEELYNISLHNSNMDLIDSALNRQSIKDSALEKNINEHISDDSNPHRITKQQISLGNVDNTSDINKPVSAKQQTAISNSLNEAKKYTDTSISDYEIISKTEPINQSINKYWIIEEN